MQLGLPFRRLPIFFLTLSVISASSLGTSLTATLACRIFRGPAVQVGQGTAMVLVLADALGKPAAVGVALSKEALQGLPPKSNPATGPLDWVYLLSFPKRGPATGFNHVMLNWHPFGHAPNGIYTVPHFDFHFYLISRARASSIRFSHDEQGLDGVEIPPSTVMPPGYFIPPGTQVSGMGVHAFAKDAPEFHGHPFTNTFSYGYYRKQLIFIEPMITLAYLRGDPDAKHKVSAPAAYSFPGYYPTSYEVRYDAAQRSYLVLLEQLRPWHIPPK